jgi:hypothetical protein
MSQIWHVRILSQLHAVALIRATQAAHLGSPSVIVLLHLLLYLQWLLFPAILSVASTKAPVDDTWLTLILPCALTSHVHDCSIP